MPPHFVQRMVQYSDPARPEMIRRTLSSAPHSGQLDRTATGGVVSDSSMGALPPRCGVLGSLFEIVDPGLGVRDRGIALGPGETDLEFGKRDAIDDDRLQIRPPDPGVPEASSRLERLDLKAVVIHVASLGDFGSRTKSRAGKNDCELVHIRRLFSPWPTNFTWEPAARGARTIQRRNAAKSRCSAATDHAPGACLSAPSAQKCHHFRNMRGQMPLTHRAGCRHSCNRIHLAMHLHLSGNAP